MMAHGSAILALLGVSLTLAGCLGAPQEAASAPEGYTPRQVIFEEAAYGEDEATAEAAPQAEDEDGQEENRGGRACRKALVPINIGNDNCRDGKP